MKRHRPQLVDRYDSIEDDERSRFSSISSLSGAKRESATYHQAQDTALPSETESLPQELTQVVTVDDQDGEIEMMLPGGPKDALCKFEAYYSDGSDVNETTASCTVTSDDLHGEDDLHGDESWADTCSQADTNTLDSDDGSRSDCDESRSLVTTESRSFISETYTVEDSKITVTTDGESYMSRSRGPTSNISDEYTLDDSKMTFRTDDSRSYESRSLLNESYPRILIPSKRSRSPPTLSESHHRLSSSAVQHQKVGDDPIHLTIRCHRPFIAKSRIFQLPQQEQIST
jgi:hypothetical protein